MPLLGYIALCPSVRKGEDHFWSQPPHLYFCITIVPNQWPHNSWELKRTNDLAFSGASLLKFGCPDETNVWTVFEASNVQNSSQGIKSTWASVRVLCFLVSATENPVSCSAPDPPNCCWGPRCTRLCWAEQKTLQTKQNHNQVNTLACTKIKTASKSQLFGLVPETIPKIACTSSITVKHHNRV